MDLKSLQDEIKGGVSAINDLVAKAKDNKENIEKGADALQKVASALKNLASNPDPAVLGDLKTEFEQVNKTLIAMVSAQQELDRKKSVDWDKVGDGIATVARVSLKVAMALV